MNIKRNNTTLAILLLAILIFGIISLNCIRLSFFAFGILKIILVSIGTIGLLLFLTLLIWIVQKFTHKFLVVVTDESITNYSYLFTIKYLRWSDVESVKMLNLGGIDYIGLEIKNYNQFKHRLSPLTKLFISFDKYFSYPPCLIFTYICQVDCEKLFNIISENLYNNSKESNNI